MKKFIASGMYVFFALSAIFMPKIVEATVEDAKKFAEEKILIYELHIHMCEEQGCNDGFIMDYRYQSGYIHGACDAYINMIKKIDQ